METSIYRLFSSRDLYPIVKPPGPQWIDFIVCHAILSRQKLKEGGI
jgi:hypothetical protein